MGGPPISPPAAPPLHAPAHAAAGRPRRAKPRDGLARGGGAVPTPLAELSFWQGRAATLPYLRTKMFIYIYVYTYTAG